jgi:ribosomal-protein-alanine N-acetyltransferase
MIQDFYRDKRLFWAIESKAEHAFLGTVCYERISPRGCGEIGYDLAKAYWGKGLMREALGEVIRFGFEDLGLKEIEALTMPANERSIDLLKKFGFELSGYKEEDYRFTLHRARWKPSAEHG